MTRVWPPLAEGRLTEFGTRGLQALSVPQSRAVPDAQPRGSLQAELLRSRAGHGNRAKRQTQPVLRLCEEGEGAAGESHSDIPCAGRDSPGGAGSPQDAWAEGLPFSILLRQPDELLCGETAQDGNTGQQRGPVKGQGLLWLPSRGPCGGRKAPRGLCRSAAAFKPESCVLWG